MNFLILSGACRAVRTCSKFRVPAFQNQMVMTHFSTAKETDEKTTPKDTPKPDKTIQPLIEKATQGEDTVDDSEIQAEWLSLEKRLAFRKPKRKGYITLEQKTIYHTLCLLFFQLWFAGEGPEGRSPLRGSAWDAENV